MSMYEEEISMYCILLSENQVARWGGKADADDAFDVLHANGVDIDTIGSFRGTARFLWNGKEEYIDDKPIYYLELPYSENGNYNVEEIKQNFGTPKGMNIKSRIAYIEGETFG